MEDLKSHSDDSSGDEFAYLILEDCEVSVQSQESSSLVETGKWIDVVIQKESGVAQSSVLDGQSVQSQSCCNLVLFQSQHDSLLLSLGQIPFFDGDLSSLKSPCACTKPARTDASLLVGMLRICDPVIAPTSCMVFFRDDARKRAALVFTLSFPFLLKGKHGSRSILGNNSKNVRLHPAVQAVLSMARSDWDFYDTFMAGTERLFNLKRLPEKRNPPLFPPKLTLEEMYKRVNGSPVVQELQRNRHELLDRNQPENCFIARLSNDTLAEHLGSYLTAESLNSLRCTCSFLHKALQAVVPGLKLRLYRHQVKSLVWMRTREASHLEENDLYKLSCSSPHSIDGDAHRAATGGLTVKLVPRRTIGKASTTNGMIRINQLNGREVEAPGSLARNVARGGLLCDDPGLGKTITVLSLLLQTAGMKPSLPPDDDANVDDDRVFDAYWNELYVIKEFRKEPLNKLLRTFLRSQRLGKSFPANRVRNAISTHGYGVFAEFEQDVETCICEFVPEGEEQCELIAAFRDAVAEFKHEKCQLARKSFSNASAKPNSQVAALLAKSLRTKFLRSLVPGKTLLVVPSVLMDHWEAQIRMHIDVKYLTKKIPVTHSFDARGKLLEIDIDPEIKFPFLFLDRGGTRKLPSPEYLSKFQIVVTSTQRFVNEWKGGSFLQEIQREGLKATDMPEYQDYVTSNSSKPVCPLLKVYWHRIIVDEGHSMAKDTGSAIQFASWLWSEKRWAMTGTPTKQTSTQLNQIKALIGFLHHDFFTSRCEGDVCWKNAVVQYWKKGSVASFFRLRSLLELIMKRHTKLDIEELPAPLFRRSIVPMSFVEVNTYNTLVAGVQSNILLTSMKGKTSGQQDSLLHRNNARHAREALANLRRVCVGWSRVVPTLTDKNWRETIYQVEATLDKDALYHIRGYLHSAETEGLSECSCCSMRLSTLLIMSCCGRLVCTECMDSQSTQCLECGEEFDVDAFQRFQPGFTLTWKSNIKTRRTGFVADVVRDHIPIPPDGGVGEAGNNIIRVPAQAAVRRTRKFGDGHVCEFRDASHAYCLDGRCIHCREEHKLCNMLNEEKRCATCGRHAEDIPEEASKAYYLGQKYLELMESRRGGNASPDERPLKMIVFSQFRQALNFVGDLLLRRFGTAGVAEYWGKHRREELHRFTHESDCFCLLLTKDGSEGLDLSFVTHIFCMEEIWDKAVQEQVIARAWRMGATGRVEVETLLAQNSVEETMQEAERSTTEIRSENVRGRAITQGERERERNKTAFLLRSLRFITDFHQFAGSRLNLADEPSASSAAKRKHSSSSTDAYGPPAKKKVRFNLDL